jgi:hypothetical protein
MSIGRGLRGNRKANSRVVFLFSMKGGQRMNGNSIVTNWILVVATVCYVIGTFLLWFTTRNALNLTRDAFRLNILVSLLEVYKPMYEKMSQDTYDRYDKLTENIRGKLSEILDPLIKDNFADKAKEILSILKKYS